MIEFICLLLAAPGLIDGPGERLSDAQKQELRQFVGLWEYKEIIHDGEARDAKALADLTIEFAENGCFMIKHKVSMVGLGRISVDRAKSPKQVDMAYSERGEFDGKLRGVTEVEGIYEIDKNGLRFCFNRDGAKKPRPTEFAAPAKSDRVFESLRPYSWKKP